MICLERTRVTAVSAALPMGGHQGEPLGRRERPLGITFPCLIVLPFRQNDLRVFAEIDGVVCVPLFLVARVVAAVLRRVLIRVSDPPTTNGIPRLLRV